MHISEGVLPATVLIAGWILTVALIVISIVWSRKKLGDISEKIPLVAVITAAFFIACLFKIPVSATSLHLVLSGLVGILLGPLAFICIFVGLVLQALLLQNGGITVLGVNSFVMGFPAMLAYFVYKLCLKRTKPAISAGAASVFSIFLSTILLAIVLTVSGITFGSLDKLFDIVSNIPVLSTIVAALSGTSFVLTLFLLMVMNFPLMIIEGIICAFIVPFIGKVKPEMLENSIEK